MEYDSKQEHYIVLDKSDTVCMNPLGYPYNGCRIIFQKSQGLADTFCIEKGMPVIQSNIVQAECNKTYILVDQKSLDKICECNPDCLKGKYGNAGLEDTSYKLCDDALNNSKIHDYWIIIKPKNMVYGPFSKDEYIQKKNELNIPESLKLDIEDQ